MKTLIRTAITTSLVCCAFGCASTPTSEPKSPSEQTASKASPKAEEKAQSKTEEQSSATSEGKGKTDTEQAQSTEPSPFANGLRKASRPPVQLITNPTALYVFNFDESEVGKTAREKCDAASDSPSERSTCLEKARSKVPVESVRFIKKGSEFWWVTLNRYKGNLLKWHVIQFQVGQEGSDRVTLKPMGKDKGIAPMAKVPRTLEIELPNDYSIVVNDQEFGKMTFDEKIGKIETTEQ